MQSTTISPVRAREYLRRGPMRYLRTFIVLSFFTLCTVICVAPCFAQKVTKRVGNISFYPYSPNSTNSLNEIPSDIVAKVTAHLKARLGEEFYSKLKFRYGVIVDLDALKRSKPDSNYKWKVFSYNLQYSFSMPELGIKLYEAEIWLDKNGEVIREIDLPAMGANPEKSKIIPIKEAVAIGKKNKFRPSRIQIAFREEDDSIVWNLVADNQDGSTSEMAISAHNGTVLNFVRHQGIR